MKINLSTEIFKLIAEKMYPDSNNPIKDLTLHVYNLDLDYEELSANKSGYDS